MWFLLGKIKRINKEAKIFIASGNYTNEDITY